MLARYLFGPVETVCFALLTKEKIQGQKGGRLEYRDPTKQSSRVLRLKGVLNKAAYEYVRTSTRLRN